MSREEYLKYVLEQYKEIFGDQFNEKRAMESAESLLNASNGDVEKAKVAAEAVINRTRAKMDASKAQQEVEQKEFSEGRSFSADDKKVYVVFYSTGDNLSQPFTRTYNSIESAAKGVKEVLNSKSGGSTTRNGKSYRIALEYSAFYNKSDRDRWIKMSNLEQSITEKQRKLDPESDEYQKLDDKLNNEVSYPKPFSGDAWKDVDTAMKGIRTESTSDNSNLVEQKEFDKVPAWVGVIYEQDVTIDDAGNVKVDGKDKMTIDVNKPFAEVLKELREALKPEEEEKEFDEYSEQMLFDDLASVKEYLHDAPAEVKAAYNQIVEYFAFGGIKNMFKGMKENRRLGQIKERLAKLGEKIAAFKEKLQPLTDEEKRLKEERASILQKAKDERKLNQ